MRAILLLSLLLFYQICSATLELTEGMKSLVKKYEQCSFVSVEPMVRKREEKNCYIEVRCGEKSESSDKGTCVETAGLNGQLIAHLFYLGKLIDNQGCKRYEDKDLKYEICPIIKK